MRRATLCGLIAIGTQCHYSYPDTGFLLFLVPPCIGAGMGALYQRMVAGMLWGLVAIILLLFLALPWLQVARE